MPGPIDPASMAVIRLCERSDCTFVVNNAIEDLKDILQAMSNHILSMHPVSGSSDGGGGGAGEPKVTRQFLRFRRTVMRSAGLLGVLALSVGS